MTRPRLSAFTGISTRGAPPRFERAGARRLGGRRRDPAHSARPRRRRRRARSRSPTEGGSRDGRVSAPILELGEGFWDVVEPARFPEHIPRFENRRWAQRVGLGSVDFERHFARFEPLPDNLQEPLALRYHGHQFDVLQPAARRRPRLSVRAGAGRSTVACSTSAPRAAAPRPTPAAATAGSRSRAACARCWPRRCWRRSA